MRINNEKGGIDMKKMIAIGTMALALTGVCADEAFTLVNDAQGYSYIQINEDLGSFKFTSDFKSIGNSGKVGFFIYPDGLSGQALKDYIANIPADNAQFAKKINGGVVDLGALKAGDRVGFYLDRNNGDIVRNWDFATKHDTTYIAFDKNGGGKDEWMSITDVKTSGTEGPSGQPLPGVLAMLALGGLGIGAVKAKKKAK